jgi:UDP-N-acetylglucosamine--N-acetylmuramyl-(pentapeptide) pyrophosphoryl-undecaprenol N-acetylglucosamine transferase
MRLLVSGGGSAGHITPVLAVLEILKRRVDKLDVLWVGQASGMEARIVVAEGIAFAPIRAGKFRRIHSDHVIKKIFNPATLGLNARDSWRFLSGIYQSIRIIRQFRPDVVFIKGGFVGVPLGLVAGWLKVPYVIHESDLVPGLANRLLAKKATKVAVGFPVDKYSNLPRHKLVYTGNPVRSQLLGLKAEDGRRHFGLSAKLPVIMVTGGSLGAREINQAIIRALPRLIEEYQVIHLTGEKEFEAVQFQVGRLDLSHPDRYLSFAFLTREMGLALAAADIVVSRAGANTIAELAVLDKPAILVPNQLMAGHQVENAQMLARAGAVRVISEDRLTADVLLRELNGITGSQQEREFLTEHLRLFAVPDAAERLANEIIAVGDHAV